MGVFAELFAHRASRDACWLRHLTSKGGKIEKGQAGIEASKVRRVSAADFRGRLDVFCFGRDRFLGFAAEEGGLAVLDAEGGLRWRTINVCSVS
jgi:hypothetical protein